MSSWYGMAEWFGFPFRHLSPTQRRHLARAALKTDPAPPCPFQRGGPACSKSGGVCSIQTDVGQPVITCPRRLDDRNLLPNWLGRIVGFRNVYLAGEVPFMHSPSTGKAAGRIDLVVAGDGNADAWFGLEVQAVYFSGQGMETDFQQLLTSTENTPPSPSARRRPAWRSSSAKRLMPQLQVKVPTLRRWGSKLAVAVDLPFFEAIGGPASQPSQDLDDGDIIWLVPRITDEYRLVEHHWEVLSLEASIDKLLSARTVKRRKFEKVLREKLQRLEDTG